MFNNKRSLLTSEYSCHLARDHANVAHLARVVGRTVTAVLVSHLGARGPVLTHTLTAVVHELLQDEHTGWIR